MDKLVIEGGHRLSGKVRASGSKNSSLPILFASILSSGKCLIENVPSLADISTTVSLLRQMGASIAHEPQKKFVSIETSSINNIEASYDLVRTMRASILVLGPTLSRFKKARVSLPGGCSIGARPVNLHLMALEKMGAAIQIKEGYIDAACDRLQGCEIEFPQISVGATENTLMAASLAKSETVLKNAALEPEIVDLANFLRTLGAKIEGDGTPIIRIKGVEALAGGTHRVIPDRIEAGTFAVAAALTAGDVTIEGFDGNLFSAVAEKLRECGVEITAEKNQVRIRSNGDFFAKNLETKEFPGFPTDMQAQFMALMCIANGTSVISENIFENRFMHVAELQRLGAAINVQGNRAMIEGFGGSNRHLSGATVMATDLRASACLVLAGLAAKGTTVVRRIYHLDRGYEKMEEKLASLGAVIRRESD